MQKHLDIDIIIAVTILTLIGLVMIYSTASTAVITRQVVWLGFSIVALFICTRISSRLWQNLAPFLYIAVILLLFMLLFFSNTYPKRWFVMGWINLQPAEFAKLATILLLAQLLAARKKLRHYSDFLVPLLIVLIPAALIFLEPDFGAAQIFLPILLVMLYWAGMPAPKIFIFFSPFVSAAASFSIYVWVVYFVLLAAFLYFRKQLIDLVYGLASNVFVGLCTPLVWNSLKGYQQQRIISFFSPLVDPRGMSWQSIQSKIAIGSGGIMGKGFLSGTQNKLEFLPERHTDFIFSCLGEEFGLIGITLTTLVFVFLFYRLLILTRSTKNRYASIVVSGILAWLGYQTFLNIGMTIGFFPITGVPLPFISYGGSSLLACFIGIGVCLAISRSKFNY
jgi:rod shape determining protein RodA